MSEASLNAQFAALHAQRVATMNPVDLGVNIRQRQQLVDNANRAGFVKPGDIAPAFTLPEVDGGTVALDELLAHGPVVLVFFRFAGCPACNIALPYYQRELYPALAAHGASLLAISPQVPEKLREIKTRHHFPFPVASDKDNALARHFGITFTANEESQANSRAKGVDLGEVTGTGTWELPMPAVIIIGAGRVVQFTSLSPDWLERAEAAEILTALPAPAEAL
jgi:peroxiredoxin